MLLVIAMSLAACSGDSDDEPAAESTPAASSTETGGDAAVRTVTNVDGEPVEVPDRAERVVVLHDFNGGAQVLSLGAPVVGLPSRGAEVDPDLAAAFDIEGIATIGEVYEPDIEAIAALDPDLLIGEGWNGESQFDAGVHQQLSAIAPVVYIDTFRSVDEVMADVAEVLGDYAQEAYEEQKAELDALIAEIGESLGDDPASVTASYLSKHNTSGTLQTSGPMAAPFTEILSRIGVTWVPLVEEAGSDANGGYLGELSMERINEFDADLVILDAFYDQTLLEDPLFQSLRASQAGQVISALPEDGNFWGTYYANHIRCAEFLRDEIEAIGTLDTSLVDESAA